MAIVITSLCGSVGDCFFISSGCIHFDHFSSACRSHSLSDYHAAALNVSLFITIKPSIQSSSNYLSVLSYL